jgi:hypothetical protein
MVGDFELKEPCVDMVPIILELSIANAGRKQYCWTSTARGDLTVYKYRVVLGVWKNKYC